jgi:hypothetical protein
VPKERSHWLLAQRAAKRLKPGPLADAVLAYQEFLLAGAVAHDSGYYAGALGSAAGRRTADRLHGADGWNTFAPFWALADRRDLGAPALAFGFGALTHLAADVTFHPLVYAWTGEAAADPPWNRGWLYRHQALEAALDRHFEVLWGQAPASVASIARRAGRELPAIQSVFSGNDARPWLAAHARLQPLFALPLAAWLVGLASLGRRGGDSDPTGVFYRGGPRLHPSFEGTMTWNHPVTGQADASRLDDLVERFYTLVLELAAEWERAWTEGTEPFARIGPHLDTGLPTDRPQTQRRFSGRPWEPKKPR